MRLVCYLGTRGCPGVVEEALREHFDPIAIVVPIEPRLLGPHLDAGATEDGLASIADILADRARKQALAAAGREEEALAGVFDQPTDARDRIVTAVLDPPIEAALADHAGEAEAETCFVARDALEILDEAGIRLEQALEPVGVELRTR